ncbi:MAG TPA: DUF881 domain-containing protein [Mycobacteriales bacterium]|nr:DUF881 domain-containing protein [Mycobacteriales bacterium]
MPDTKPRTTSAADSDTAPEVSPAPGSPWRALVRLRATRAQAIVALLCGLLGFALVTQVHTHESSGGLAAARQEDLIGILNDLSAREDRLRTEIDGLETSRARLLSGSDQRQAALEEAQRRAQTLGIVAGTIAAQGPGIVLTIDDPKRTVGSDVLLDAMEELRDAGAETMQVGSVRVVASTYFTQGADGMAADGQPLQAPYRFIVIGDPRTLAAAMTIPGGVIDTVAAAGGGAKAAVASSNHLVVSALRPPQRAR